MNKLINLINTAVTKITDLLLIPFKSFSPSWGLFVISALSGVFLIYIYGKVSNQKAIKSVKRKIAAYLLEVILYRHDIVQCLKAQGGMLFSGARYFILAVPPLIVLMIPCIVILSQLNLRYETRNLNPGESLLFTAKVNSPDQLMNISLSPSEGLSVSEPVRIEGDNEITWKVTANQPGEDLKLSLKSNNGQSVDKQLAVAGSSTLPYGHLYKSWLWTILYPQDKSQFGKMFSEIKLNYPKADNYLFGIKMHWILVFFIVSLASGLVAAKLFKIEI